jgi:hypothetical protein
MTIVVTGLVRHFNDVETTVLSRYSADAAKFLKRSGRACTAQGMSRNRATEPWFLARARGEHQVVFDIDTEVSDRGLNLYVRGSIHNHFRAGSGNLNRRDKWIFCLNAA